MRERFQKEAKQKVKKEQMAAKKGGANKAASAAQPDLNAWSTD